MYLPTHTYSCSSSLSFSDQVLTLRANLLLNQYAAAMLVALGQPGGRGRGAQASGGIPLPETQQLVNHLVLDPLSSPRGHGSMILVRSAGDQSLTSYLFSSSTTTNDAYNACCILYIYVVGIFNGRNHDQIENLLSWITAHVVHPSKGERLLSALEPTSSQNGFSLNSKHPSKNAPTSMCKECLIRT